MAPVRRFVFILAMFTTAFLIGCGSSMQSSTSGSESSGGQADQDSAVLDLEIAQVPVPILASQLTSSTRAMAVSRRFRMDSSCLRTQRWAV